MFRLGGEHCDGSKKVSNAEIAVDPTHAVTQRLGLPSFALGAVVIRGNAIEF